MKAARAIIGAGIAVAGFYIVGRTFADFALKRGSGADSAVKKTIGDAAPSPAQITESEKKKEAREWSMAVKPSEHELVSADGLRLHGFLYENEAPGNRYAILLHGFQDDHEFMEPYALEYYRKGYHVLIPDQRAHGKSGGAYTTMGWRERDDLRGWIQWILDRAPETEILLHGVSMGAATIMLAAGDGVPANVRVCIADCGYTSLREEYQGKIKEMFHVPAAPLLVAADLAARVKPGFWIHRVSPADALRGNRTPILFIHGDADNYNPYWMMDTLYHADACGEKEKLTIHGGKHARSIYADNAAYWSTVWRFSGKYIGKPLM